MFRQILSDQARMVIQTPLSSWPVFTSLLLFMIIIIIMIMNIIIIIIIVIIIDVHLFNFI